MYTIFEDFYYKTLENDINKEMVFYNYHFPKAELSSYVNELINTDITYFLKWQDSNYTSISISSSDVIQFSSFNDVLRLPHELINCSDNGVKCKEAGSILLNDGKERNKGALVKYGENHLKTCEYLGYLFSLENTFFVSCIGYINEQLSTDDRNKLLVRLIIRTNLFRIVYMLQKNDKVNLRKLFDFLSNSTYKRRISNVKKIFSILNGSNEYDFSVILNRIIY